MTSRERFEAWARESGFNPRELKRDSFNDYEWQAISGLWDCWQAASTQGAPVEVGGLRIPGVIPAPDGTHQLWTRWSDRYAILATPDDMAKELADCEAQAVLELDRCGKPGWWASKVEKIKEGIATYEARAALGRPAAVGAPEGYTIVPIEPTLEMEIAGMEASVMGRASIDDPTYVLSIYRAMIQAAPAWRDG